MNGWILMGWLGLGAMVSAAPVSYTREVAPLLRRHCNGCHNPSKSKGGVDLTTVSALVRVGKHGAVVVARDAAAGTLMEQIRGTEPAMPKEGDRLTGDQVALLERWIREGALDDSAPEPEPTTPPVYAAAPVFGALDWSPDGRWLAVAGTGEVLLLNGENLERERRLLGAARRVDAVRFSPDSTRLAVVGGDPAVVGIFQVWEVGSWRRAVSVRTGADLLMGADWSPDGSRVACGGTDRAVHVFSARDGAELLQAQVHADWVLGAVFVDGGQRLVSGSRDRTMRLLEAGSGALVDVINREGEPIVRLARRPGTEQVAFAGAESRVRLYLAAPRPPAADPGQDPNAVQEYEAYADGTTALVFSADGRSMAIAGMPSDEVRVHRVSDGRKMATFKGHGGPVFGMAFSPDGKRLVTAGYEGLIRVFEVATGRMLAQRIPVEVTGRNVSAGSVGRGPAGRP
jgi:WD40 repeat protein